MRRKVKIEAEDWEFEDYRGRRVDIIANPEAISSRDYYNHLRRNKVMSEKEAIALVGGYSKSEGFY